MSASRNTASFFAAERFWGIMVALSIVFAAAAWLTDTPDALSHGSNLEVLTTGSLTILGKAAGYFLVAGFVAWLIRMGYRALPQTPGPHTFRKAFAGPWGIAVTIDIIGPLL